MIRELAQLVENNTVLRVGTDLFVGFIPPDDAENPSAAPDTMVAIMESTPGQPSIYLKDQTTKFFDFYCRSFSYNTARLMATALYKLLHLHFGFWLPQLNSGDDEWIVNASLAQMNPYYMGQDERGRHQFFLLMRMDIQGILAGAGLVEADPMFPQLHPATLIPFAFSGAIEQTTAQNQSRTRQTVYIPFPAGGRYQIVGLQARGDNQMTLGTTMLRVSTAPWPGTGGQYADVSLLAGATEGHAACGITGLSSGDPLYIWCLSAGGHLDVGGVIEIVQETN